MTDETHVVRLLATAPTPLIPVEVLADVLAVTDEPEAERGAA